MLENEFNSIITKSFNSQGGFAFKIPDARSTITQFHSKNPYDIYGIFENHFWAWESKWLQKPASFSFDRLEQHQIDNLIKSFELLNNAIAVFAIGVDWSRSDKRVYIWKNEELYTIRDRKLKKQNIFKKEFEQRTNFVKLAKGELNIKEVLNLAKEDIIL